MLTQVNDPDSECLVPDSRYLRSQAELYFELARHMSERHAADSFRVAATEFLTRALEIEAQDPSPAAANWPLAAKKD